MSCDSVRCSVLDFCRRDPQQHASQSLRSSLELAVTCERLGYTRYWVAEHHNALAAQASPEVLIAAIASRTQHIRVGAGAVLLQYYSPFHVAEIYLALEALFPGRIDLGLARGPGVNSPATALKLVSNSPAELQQGVFEQKVLETVTFLREAAAASSPEMQAALAQPYGVHPPIVWLLGSGSGTLDLARSLNLPFVVGLFFDGVVSLPNLNPKVQQKAQIVRSTGVCRAVAMTVLCSSTVQKALHREHELIEAGFGSSNIVGTAEHCAEVLLETALSFAVDEVIVATWTNNLEERIFIFSSLAAKLGLSAKVRMPS